MMKFLMLSLSILFFMSGCKKDEELKSLDLEITSGFICGWCAGADSIIIKESGYTYINFNPCTLEALQPEKSGELNAMDWNRLVSLLDFDTFKSIELNRCNVCVDGCDNWVEVRQGNEIHQITFGHSSTDSLVLEPIMPFVEKLDELKADLIKE